MKKDAKIRYKKIDYVVSGETKSLNTIMGELILNTNALEFNSFPKKFKILPNEIRTIRQYNFPFFKWAENDIAYFPCIAIDTDERTHYFAPLIEDNSMRFFSRLEGREKIYDPVRVNEIYKALNNWWRAHQIYKERIEYAQKLNSILKLSRTISLDSLAEALGISKGEVISLIAEVSSSYKEFPFEIDGDNLVRKSASDSEIDAAIDEIIESFERKKIE